MQWIVPPVAGLIEPAPAPVIWIDGVGAIAFNDGVITSYYFVERQSLIGAETEKTVEVIIRRPATQVIQGIGNLSRVAQHIMTSPTLAPDTHPPRGFKPRVVK